MWTINRALPQGQASFVVKDLTCSLVEELLVRIAPPSCSKLVKLQKLPRQWTPTSAYTKAAERYTPIRTRGVSTILDRRFSTRDKKVFCSIAIDIPSLLLSPLLLLPATAVYYCWKCCKPRVLTFEEFLVIPPCTTGKHSDVDDTPPEKPKPAARGATAAVDGHDIPGSASAAAVEYGLLGSAPTARAPVAQTPAPPPPAPPESESDDASIPLTPDMKCRRRGCHANYSGGSSRENEKCTFHPGAPVFHDGGKGYTCCRPRVLEFDDFMRIEGCTTKPRHMFVGSGKKLREKQAGEEVVESVKNDFYQTSSALIVSFYLKKIDRDRAKVEFSSPLTVDLDLPTADNRRYRTQVPLYGPIDPEKSTFKIMGTKLEMSLAKADRAGWPSLRSDERRTGQIIQVGQAGSL